MTTALPLVSVIIPVYNVQEYLPQCIESVLRQSYPHIEVVVVNDGSTDNSLAICCQYAQCHNYIKLIDKSNEGVAATRNVGLFHATGDYILFVDADDWIEHDMISFLVDNAVQTGNGIVVCGMVTEDAPLRQDYHLYQREHRQVIEMFLFHRELTGSLWNKLFDKSLLQGISFNPAISYGEDALFLWQVLKQYKGNVTITDQQFYHYRMNNDSISHGFGGKKFTAFDVWQSICNDTARFYPDLLPMAQAEYCSQMIVILYDAARHGYPYDSHVYRIQQVINNFLPVLKQAKNYSQKKYFSAFLLVHCYNVARILLPIRYRRLDRTNLIDFCYLCTHETKRYF